MIINKLLPSVQSSLKTVGGTSSKRIKNSKELAHGLFLRISGQFKDNNSTVSFRDIQKQIDEIIPDKNFEIILKHLPSSDKTSYDGICKGIVDRGRNIKAISIETAGLQDAIKAYHLPVLIHEFQHAADDFYNPKFISRSQKLIKKGLETKEYNQFYDDYYYCEEYAKSRKKRRYVLKIIKEKTLEFLKDFDISDKIDYLQDIRYSLMTEYNAYQTQRKVAYNLQSRGLKTHPYNFENYPKIGLFDEKIKLLKNLLKDIIAQERHFNSNN